VKKAIYRIKITNWKKYQKQRKKGYRSILISERFLDDAKIASQTPVTRLLFLSCLLATSQSDEGQCEVTHESLARQSGVKSKSIESQLGVLQSLQLLTYEKIAPLIEVNLIEDKINKDKLKPKGERSKKGAARPPDSAAPVIAAYCDFWRSRYKSESSPTIMPHHARMIKSLVAQVGSERAKVIVEAYLKMPDSWFLTKRHDIPTMIGNLNSITQFMDTGKLLTRNEIRQLDNAVTNQQTLEALRMGDI
jgi:hypothetical protein